MWYFCLFVVYTILYLTCLTVRGHHCMAHHEEENQTISIGDRSGLQAGQSSTRTLYLRSHAVVTPAEWGLALSCWNRHGVPGKSFHLDDSIFQHKPPHQWYLHIYADHPCRGHWCTPIPSQRMVFALFFGNGQDGLFHLWHVESYVRFSQKQAEMWTCLTREHVSTIFCPSPMISGSENLPFLHKIHKCLPLCIMQFQVAFLDAEADYVEWQWFSKVLLMWQYPSW